MDTVYASVDVLIIGGGINGAGIARDAAGRGLSVVLAEKGDLASATSSSSTKLVHGGLRYLEHYEFRLVREALKEREVLLRSHSGRNCHGHSCAYPLYLQDSTYLIAHCANVATRREFVDTPHGQHVFEIDSGKR